MTLAGAWARAPIAAGVSIRARNSLAALCIYAGLYLVLDRISFVHVLPAVGFTLWNPPAACTLALLVIGGLRYAPAVLVVSLVSDGLVAGYPAGLMPTLVAEAISVIGYAAVAVPLRHFADAHSGFQDATHIAWFLLVAVLGVLAIGCLTTGAFVLMHVLPAAQFKSAARHFWIGDLTGIVGLFPALMSIQLVRGDWNKMTPLHRLRGAATFMAGLLLALFVVFGVAGYQELHFFYLLLLPVIWVAVRYGLAWSAIAVFVTQLGLISTVIALDHPASEFFAFQLLSLTVSATGLLVGAVVTERQRAEARLRRQQAELDRMARLTTAGALGMAVVHQISQPLATIATYTHACRQLLQVESTDKAILADTMAKAEAEVLRAGTIIDRLRDFLSDGNKHLSAVDLSVVAREIVATLTDGARRRGIGIQVLASTTPTVMVDRIQIEQVLVNLIRNAIEAMAEQDHGEKHVRIGIRAVDDEVEVAVEDDGPGVSPEMANRLFEPFETNKRNGMGLGLWLSRELVDRHGGRLWWDPAASAGARFVFRLPRSADDYL